MYPEIYIDYAIRLLEACKKRKNRKRKLQEGWLEKLEDIFNNTNFNWENILGEKIENIAAKFEKKVSEFVDKQSVTLGRQIKKEFKEYITKLSQDPNDLKYKEYIFSQYFRSAIETLEKAKEECVYGIRKSHIEYTEVTKYTTNKNKREKTKQKKYGNCSSIIDVYHEIKDLFPNISKKEELYYKFKRLPLPVKILLIFIGLLIIGITLYLIFKSVKFAFSLVKDLLRGNKLDAIKYSKYSPEALIQSIIAASSATSTVKLYL